MLGHLSSWVNVLIVSRLKILDIDRDLFIFRNIFYIFDLNSAIWFLLFMFGLISVRRARKGVWFEFHLVFNVVFKLYLAFSWFCGTLVDFFFRISILTIFVFIGTRLWILFENSFSSTTILSPSYIGLGSLLIRVVRILTESIQQSQIISESREASRGRASDLIHQNFHAMSIVFLTQRKYLGLFDSPNNVGLSTVTLRIFNNAVDRLGKFKGEI